METAETRAQTFQGRNFYIKRIFKDARSYNLGIITHNLAKLGLVPLMYKKAVIICGL